MVTEEGDAEVNAEDIMRIVKERAERRRTGRDYGRSQAEIDVREVARSARCRELRDSLTIVKSSAEPLTTPPITTGMRWPFRWIGMRYHRRLRQEISYAIDPTLRSQQAFNLNVERMLNAIVNSLENSGNSDIASLTSQLKLLNARLDQFKQTQTSDIAALKDQLEEIRRLCIQTEERLNKLGESDKQHE